MSKVLQTMQLQEFMYQIVGASTTKNEKIIVIDAKLNQGPVKQTVGHIIQLL
jgi:hypothetical protein